MPYFYFDPTYILVLIGVVLSLIASAQVKSAYKKYEKVSTRSGFTAEQVAAMILRNAGIIRLPLQQSVSQHMNVVMRSSMRKDMRRLVFVQRSCRL